MHLMLEKFKFPLHCLALKKYLLLGAGDFIQVLLDQLCDQLDQNAESIFQHNLLGVLEAAIRASNAQFEDTAILDRLSVRLLQTSQGDCGWDVFSLDYVVSSPLNVVFTEEAINKYLRVFNFLWRLKRVEHCLANTWNRNMSMARRVDKDVERQLLKSHILRAEMHHFVQNLHNYMMFEVLECAWKDLVDEISESKDLEELIRAHENYLEQIVDKALMGDQSVVDGKDLLSHLTNIFKVILPPLIFLSVVSVCVSLCLLFALFLRRYFSPTACVYMYYESPSYLPRAFRSVKLLAHRTHIHALPGDHSLRLRPEQVLQRYTA